MSTRTACFVHMFWMTASVAISSPMISSAQNAPGFPPEGQITSTNWEERREAFALLIGADVQSYVRSGIQYVAPVLNRALESDPITADRRATELIRLLEVENQEVSQKEQLRIDTRVSALPDEDRLSEEYVTYYGDVIAAVATLRDTRSLDAMVGAISTGGMATRTLVAFGAITVRPVAELFAASSSEVERSSAIRVLSDMLRESDALSNDPSSRSIIRETLTRAAIDESFLVRRNAVVGLARLGDVESVALVERIAETDPYQAEFAEDRFVVREAARQALAEVR